MNDDDLDLFLMAIVAVFCFCLGGFAGKASERQESRAEAVKAGVAEYYLDKDNNKQFRYIKQNHGKE